MAYKGSTLKRCLALTGVIFLTGTILHEKKPAAASDSRLTVPELTYAWVDIPQPATNRGFLDNVNLSLESPVKMRDPDPDHAGSIFRRDLPSGNFDRLQTKLGDATKPAFTMTNRELSYKLFGSGGFAFKLNLKPAYSNPEVLAPMRVDSGFGISIKF